MSTARPWYKRYPAQFISGTYRMTAEEKGVYSTLIDLMYDRSGPLEDDPKELARICGCSTRRFNVIKEKLASKYDKLVIRKGLIINKRALEQIGVDFGDDDQEEKDDLSDQKALKNGHENHPVPNENNVLALSRKEEEEELTPQAPLSGGTESDWIKFQAVWPNSDKQKPKAKEIFYGLSPPDRAAAIAGIAGVHAEAKALRRNPPTAPTYLAERRWEGLASSPKSQAPQSSTHLITAKANPELWAFWKRHYAAAAAAGDITARTNLALMNAREKNETGFVKVPRELPKQLGAEAAE